MVLSTQTGSSARGDIPIVIVQHFSDLVFRLKKGNHSSLPCIIFSCRSLGKSNGFSKARFRGSNMCRQSLVVGRPIPVDMFQRELGQLGGTSVKCDRNIE